ncbi:MAG TPA: hypothetical protein PKE57_04260, partial [Cellvibrionaceae bacterium]|nr:hypothetical protein [Cellvibrionaceae bacterium]
MSKELLIDECKKLCRELRLSRLENLIPTMHNFSDFDGPSPHECENDIRFVFGVFKNLDENRAWGEISWYALKSLGQRLREISNLASQCHSSRDQAIYESFALGLDSFVHELRASGISFLSEGGANIERASVALSLEMEKVIKARDNFEKLQDEVRMLITPVVAGSLSQSFA